MVNRAELLDFCAHLLEPSQFKDYCPNGLQIEGRTEVKKILLGVTANQAMIEHALNHEFDTILVHHGFFWGKNYGELVGLRLQRARPYLEHDLNLMAYHLPLDAHPSIGNNAQLAKKLGLKDVHFETLDGQPGLLAIGRLEPLLSADDFATRIEQELKRTPLYVGHSPMIETVAVCTGAAQTYLEKVYDLGVDAFVTGEHSLASIELARESGMHFFSAGHHATERYGIMALGDAITQAFDVTCEFLDVENPA